MMKSTSKDTVEIRSWVHRGNMLVNTEALSYNDRDHPYNQIIDQGCTPEDFGIEHPLMEKYASMSKSQLIGIIKQLEAEIESNERFQL